jgi:vacuolar-type H+-ATPase subunit I/STV1
MRRGSFSLSFGAIYLIVGVIVAAINDYFDNLDSGLRIGTAAVAVLIWPLILFGIDVELK